MRILGFVFGALAVAAVACATSEDSELPVTQPAPTDKSPSKTNPVPGSKCSSGAQECAGTCVNVQTDSAHCGACGKACGAGETCVAGACANADAGTTCSPGRKLCGSACVDVESDRENCGECAKICPGTDICKAGKCEPAPSGCANASDTKCATGCVDTSTDPKNCGVCGKACAPGGRCVDKKCENPVEPTECPPNQTLCEACTDPFTCSNVCVDLQTSQMNCGFCNRVCAAVFVCSAGTCVDR